MVNSFSCDTILQYFMYDQAHFKLGDGWLLHRVLDNTLYAQLLSMMYMYWLWVF